MWKEPSDTSSSSPNPTTSIPPATSDSPSGSASDSNLDSNLDSTLNSSAGMNEDRPHRVKVRITRPDGTSRDVAIAGHFREEHLCSLVDDELCRLDDGESLVLHLFHPDDQLTHSLQNRWQEGMSDNRHVFVREVLGPNNDRQQLATQLRRIKERMASGERINLAIRSPRVAKVAREQLRKLLLVSQQFEESLLNLWVHGDEEQQQKILGHLEGAGLVRTQDYEEFVSKHSDRRWRAPWIDVELPGGKTKHKRRHRKSKTSGDAVTEWIKRVEEEREHPHH